MKRQSILRSNGQWVIIAGGPASAPVVGGGTPVAPVAVFTYSKSNLIVIFDASASTPAAAMTYAWNFGDGGTSTSVSPNHTYTSAGTYTVTLTVSVSGSGSAVSTQTVSVQSAYVDNFVLRTTKPNATNTGAGIIRAYPTTVINGDITMSTNGQVLKDTIVYGRVSVKAADCLIENCVIYGPQTEPSGGVWLVNTSSGTNATVRFNTIRANRTSRQVNGIGLRNFSSYRNNISRVIDGIDPNPSATNGPVNASSQGDFIHDLMFFAPDPGHDATPTPASYTGPWASQPWSHDDGVQVTGGSSGFTMIGTCVVATWATDIGTSPLPTINKELSCFMLNACNSLSVEDCWLDGGEYCVNGTGAGASSGSFKRNKFGRQMVHSSSADSSYYTLVLSASGSWSTYDGTADQNVFEDTGNPITVRRQ